MKKNIVWLASYPKSGNTWVRLFLANYLMNRPAPLPINEVRRFGTGDAIAQHYRRAAGRPIDPADWQTVVGLRPRVLRAIASNGADANVVKTHNIRTRVQDTELFPPEITRAAVYVMRNPLDMVLSYARHYSMTPADSAVSIGRSDNAVLGDASAVTQFLGSWSEHVTAWTGAPPFPTLVLRYEDMLHDPEAAFTRLLEHLGVTPDTDRLARAIRFCSFDELTRQESEAGFGERAAADVPFFVKGQSGYWREELSRDVAKQVKRDHRKVMKKHGYLE